MAVVERLSELGYDSPEAITSSVMQPSYLDNWIQMLLEMHLEWRGKIPQERWHLAPIAGKLRMVWEKCYEVVPFKSAHKAEQQEEHGNASIQEDANTGVLEDDDLDNRKHNEFEAQPNPTQRDQDKHQGIAKGAEGQDNQDKHAGPPAKKRKQGNHEIATYGEPQPDATGVNNSTYQQTTPFGMMAPYSMSHLLPEGLTERLTLEHIKHKKRTFLEWYPGEVLDRTTTSHEDQL